MFKGSLGLRHRFYAKQVGMSFWYKYVLLNLHVYVYSDGVGLKVSKWFKSVKDVSDWNFHVLRSEIYAYQTSSPGSKSRVYNSSSLNADAEVRHCLVVYPVLTGFSCVPPPEVVSREGLTKA